jgi:hypothetical protein
MPINKIAHANNKLDLNMVCTCDYFVSKSLRIYYKDPPFYSVIEFSTECCKYNDNNMKPNLLLPRPIIVYTNNSYTLPSLEKKYGKMIQEKVSNDTQTIDNVTKILKLELLLEK